MDQRVEDLIAEQLGVELDQVTTEASLMDDLGADSLDLVELVMALEEEFEIEITDDEGEKLKTVGEVVDLIKAKTGE